MTSEPTPQERAQSFVEGLPELFRLWDSFYEADRPVAQADSLLQFSNALYHLRIDFEGFREEDGRSRPISDVVQPILARAVVSQEADQVIESFLADPGPENDVLAAAVARLRGERNAFRGDAEYWVMEATTFASTA